MTDLDRELTELAAHLSWPEPPNVAPRVSATITRGRSPSTRRLLAAAAVVVVVVAIVGVVPAARDQVAAWFGIGGVTIERGTLLEPDTIAELGDAIRLSSLGAPLPSALGDPDAAYRDAEGRVWIVYEPTGDRPGALLTVFESVTDAGLTKLVADPSRQVELVEVNGESAYWVAGADHFLLFGTPDGQMVEDRGRLSSPTLIWVLGDLTYRLESEIGRDRAISIAESVA